MDYNALYESFRQETASPAKMTPWEIGNLFEEHLQRLKTQGVSQGCKSQEEVLALIGMKKTRAMLCAQVAKNLDPKEYGEIPLSKLQWLLTLGAEEQRQRFMEKRDVRQMSVRELKDAVRSWKERPLIPNDSDNGRQETDSAEKITEKERTAIDAGQAKRLLGLIRTHVALGNEIAQILENLLGDQAIPETKKGGQTEDNPEEARAETDGLKTMKGDSNESR